MFEPIITITIIYLIIGVAINELVKSGDNTSDIALSLYIYKLKNNHFFYIKEAITWLPALFEFWKSK